ncbi:MAG: hypothetical protein GWP61_21750 [Chloroflexi bacterium]|jgi:uncharacterized membrane protein YhhN|nr:hypothetical protein [Chloroflexota bacterium]
MTQTTDGSYNSSFDELRVFARTVGLLAVLTAILYLRAIASGGFLYRGDNATIPVTTILFVLMLMATAGLVLTWRWECLGGIVAIIGSMAVAVIVYSTFAENRLLATLVYSSPFLVSGSLCMLDWWKHR